MSTSEETKQMMQDSDLALVKQAVDFLKEHFEAVQVFVSRDDSDRLGGTTNCNMGSGNYYARYGQVSLWVIAQEQDGQ